MCEAVAGWIWEDNVGYLMRHLSILVGYSFDDLDEDAVTTGLLDTDADLDRWFEYPLIGMRRLTVYLARHPDAQPVSVRVNGELDVVLAARAETLMDVLSDIR